ncbi:MAG: NADH:flavin oxidoreductase [Magnetococcales bacterium]|nr:NADH:flavin oxidoreductase [Magnetococcales bacterium]
MIATASDNLFQPVRLGGLDLPNRIVMAPMTRSQCPDGIPTDQVAAYYARRAAHDVGLIITEGVLIDDPAAGGYPNCPHLHSSEALQGWRKVIDAVHAFGSKIMPQIWHVGETHRLGDQPRPEQPGIGPSERRSGDQLLVRAMSAGDIARIVAAYADAARHAREIGFDGVEIHGAHGYLVDQFLWQGTNQRDDDYGGSFANRLRFAVEVTAAVRAAVGKDFPLIFRFSQWKPQDYSARLAETQELLSQLLGPLKEAGVDIFHASSRRYWEAEFPGSDLNLAGWVKQLTGCPVITVGSVGLDNVSWGGANATGIDPLLERLSRGEFDLVAVGRALLADYAWARKVRQGRMAEMIPYTKASLKQLD